MVSALIGDALLLAGGIGVLYFGAEWLVRGSARLAGSLGVSPIVVGLTIVSFGTSAPELVVCSVAALGGNSDLAMGNVMGSNLANLGLILGLTALIRPLDVQARVVWREVPIMLLVTALVFPLAWDGSLQRTDAMILLMALGAYLVFVFQSVGDEAPEILCEYEDFVQASTKVGHVAALKDVGLVVAGSVFLVSGGYAIVEGAVNVADAMGISQTVIGLTVVAVGTSLPELATSIVACVRNEADIAVGNVIGSNIFNIAGILGVSAALEPIFIDSTLLSRELSVLLILSVVIFPLLRTDWRITRVEGAILLAGYIGAGFWLL